MPGSLDSTPLPVTVHPPRHRSRPRSVRIRLVAASFLAATLAAGCAIVAPKVPPYTGADTVDAVSTDAFVGEWRVVALNPIEGQEVPERTLAFAADGTFTGAVFPTSEMADALGDEPIRMRGTWGVDGGRFVSTTDEVDMPARDDLVSRIVAQTMRRTAPVATEAEIYEVEPRRIVIVTDRGDANALERR